MSTIENRGNRISRRAVACESGIHGHLYSADIDNVI